MRALPWLLVALVACSAGAESGSGAPGSVSEPRRPCGPPPGDWVEGRDPPAYCVDEVAGTVVADSGEPLPDLNMTVCGLACFGGRTDAGGAFRVRVGARLPDGQYALFAHGRPRHASLFVRLPPAPPERVAFAAPITLPALSTEGAALPADDGPAATVTVGPLTLGVPASTSWRLAFEDLTDDVNGRVLRFVKVPLDRAPPFAAGATLVYALAPFEAHPSNPVSLALAETGGLAAGSAVEILVMDGLDLEADNSSGVPRVAARGHVTEDGARIETDPGEGLTLLTWIAVRAETRPAASTSYP